MTTTAASLITNPLFIATNTSNQPLAGGKLYTYAAGTLTPLATYTDATLTVPNTNPVILDEFGSAQVWLGPYTYKLNLTDVNNVQQANFPIDNLVGNTISQILLASSNGASLIGSIAPYTSTVNRTQQNRDNEIVSILDFGATGNGITDDTLAIQNAIAYCIVQQPYVKGSCTLRIPAPSVFYKISNTLNFNGVYNITIDGGNNYGVQRQSVQNTATDYGTFQWYGATGVPMISVGETQSMIIQNISLNGMGVSGVAGIVLGANNSLARQITLSNLVVKYCDFGIVVGSPLNATADVGPVLIDNLYAYWNTSSALLVNSGDAFVTMNGGFLLNNGWAPSGTQTWISSGNNLGTHISHLTGWLTINGTVSDYDVHPPALATILQAGGSVGAGELKLTGFHDDGPSMPFYSGGSNSCIIMNGCSHYDGTGQATFTGNSINYSGSQPLVLESCFFQGNVNITSGNSSIVIDLGTVFNTHTAWNASTAYVVGNNVSVAGVNYNCILANTNQTPPNATYWQLGNFIGNQLPNGLISLNKNGLGGASINAPGGLQGPLLANSATYGGVAGSIGWNSGQGLQIWPKAGTTNDIGIFNSSAIVLVLSLPHNSSVLSMPGLQGSTTYSNDAAAAGGGVPVGGLYRNGSVVQIRIS